MGGVPEKSDTPPHLFYEVVNSHEVKSVRERKSYVYKAWKSPFIRASSIMDMLRACFCFHNFYPFCWHSYRRIFPMFAFISRYITITTLLTFYPSCPNVFHNTIPEIHRKSVLRLFLWRSRHHRFYCMIPDNMSSL